MTPRPEYKGAKAPWTDDGKAHCLRCVRLATHRSEVQVEVDGQLTARYVDFCDLHLNEAIRNGEPLWHTRVFKEYRIFLRKLEAWQAQFDHGEQTAMFG